ISTQRSCMGSSSQLNSEYGRPKPHHVAMATSAAPRTERRKSRGCESVPVTRPPLRRGLAEVLDEGRGQRGGGVGGRHHVDAQAEVARRRGRHRTDAGDRGATVGEEARRRRPAEQRDEVPDRGAAREGDRVDRPRLERRREKSEERRVGKEWRSWRGAEAVKR